MWSKIHCRNRGRIQPWGVNVLHYNTTIQGRKGFKCQRLISIFIKLFHKIQHSFMKQDKQKVLNKLGIEGIYQTGKPHPILLHHGNL